MIQKIAKYQEIVDGIVDIFSELEFVLQSIKDNFIEEQKQDPRLTISIVNDCIRIVANRLNLFKNSRNLQKSKWSFEKNIKYLHESLRSFHREFDNPFLGSQKWYQKIVQLQDQLSQQSRALNKLIDKE